MTLTLPPICYNSPMTDSSPTPTLNCTQCGGVLHPDQGQLFLTCPFCNSTVFLDKSRVVFHWYLTPTVDESEASSNLARWMAGNDTVKDLDKKSTLSGHTFEYFPMWYFKRRNPKGQEEIILQPAAATSVSEVRRINLPAGDLQSYDPNLDSQSRPPTVPLDSALGWLAEQNIPADQIIESALVHLPVNTFKYTFQNRSYTALVEAATGGVFANIFPAKAEAPYMMAGGAAALVFLCLATFPLMGGAFGGGGFITGLLVCSGLGVPAAIGLFALAIWVAAKV